MGFTHAQLALQTLPPPDELDEELEEPPLLEDELPPLELLDDPPLDELEELLTPVPLQPFVSKHVPVPPPGKVIVPP
jgi:hypothetical protein